MYTQTHLDPVCTNTRIWVEIATGILGVDVLRKAIFSKSIDDNAH